MAVEHIHTEIDIRQHPYFCKQCEEVKGPDDFYRSSKLRCKSCTCANVRKNREAKADRYRAYDRKRYRDNPHRQESAKRSSESPAGLRSRAASTARLRKENPEKFKARNAVNNAIRDGKISRKPCHFCQSTENLHAHHEDYDHPLDVVWLCASCHGKLHGIKGDFRRT